MNRISQAITEIYKIHRECEIDRWINNDVYESMLLRGYEGEYYTDMEKSHFIQSFLYFTIWLTVIILCRIIHIFDIIGIMLL